VHLRGFSSVHLQGFSRLLWWQRMLPGVAEERGALAMLDEPLVQIATAEIVAGDRPRHEVQADIRRKERAREVLVKR
jgi:hypothetical protein